MRTKENPENLGKIVRTIAVGQRAHHRVSKLEDILLSTTVMQRMRRLRQMGLAYFAFPLAEHSRFIHSLGTVYWALEMLDGLTLQEQTLQRRNAVLIAEMEDLLGSDISLELVIRTYALIHDVGLLPLGHTLRLQLARFEKESRFSDTFGYSVHQLADECLELGDSDSEIRELITYLALAEAVAHVPRILRGEPLPETLLFLKELSSELIQKMVPVLCFVYDLVHGVYGADLLDWFVRDMSALGDPAEVPRLLIEAGAVVTAQPGTPAFPLDGTEHQSQLFRYGVDCQAGNGGGGIGALLHLAAMHRSRLAVILRGAYSDRKLSADAMLDKAFRILASEMVADIASFGGLEALLQTGDDEFLAQLNNRLLSTGRANPIADLHSGVLPMLVFESVGEEADQLLGLIKLDPYTPEGRNRIEDRLALETGTNADEIIVAASPRHMQGKEPTTLVRLAGKPWQPLSLLTTTTGIASDIADLNSQYADERRVMILLHRRDIENMSRMKEACERLFK